MSGAKEALAALDRHLEFSHFTGHEVVRAALEAAAEEAETWKAILGWLGDDDARDLQIGPSAIGKRGTWTCRLIELHEAGYQNDEQPSFEVALALAAAWCREEMAK